MTPEGYEAARASTLNAHYTSPISPMGLPTAAAWLLGKVQGLWYAIQDRIYR